MIGATSPSDRFRIEGGMLVEETGRHTCGTGPGGHYGAHEPGCGLEPVIPLGQLDAMLTAGVRFAARLVDSGDLDDRQRVELWVGSPYDPTGFRHDRRPVAVVELEPEAARDLVTVLGEPLPSELPEHERPAWDGPL